MAAVIALCGAGIAWTSLSGPRAAADRATAAAADAQGALQRDTASHSTAAGATQGTADPKEKEALEQYEAARDWIKKHPADMAGGAEKLGSLHGAEAVGEDIRRYRELGAVR